MYFEPWLRFTIVGNSDLKALDQVLMDILSAVVLKDTTGENHTHVQQADGSRIVILFAAKLEKKLIDCLHEFGFSVQSREEFAPGSSRHQLLAGVSQTPILDATK